MTDVAAVAARIEKESAFLRDVLREVERLYHQRHSRKRYPDYPEDRRPIDDYPARSGHPRSVKKH